MSLTLATVADALIEFILSLLRDPVAAAEFEEDPEQALADRGLQHVSPSDVAAVAPIIIERTHVVQVPVQVPVPPARSPERDHSQVAPGSSESDHAQVVNEIRQVTTHFQWVDDRDTIVDQSVNQNIWAEGDVTQTFDNQASVASGDEAVAAGEDAAVDKTWDDSTTIEAGEDVNIGNDTEVEVIDDSLNEQTDASTTTDESTTVVIDDSANQEPGSSDHSGDDETPDTGDTAPVDADSVVLPVEQPVSEAVGEGLDAAAQYADVDIADQDGAFTGVDSLSADEGTDDDNF